MESTHTLTLRGLTKRYGDLTAPDHVDVTFTPGVYGILGANGTDILKLGRDFRAKLGYMPQQQGFYESMTADTFLHYMAEVKGGPGTCLLVVVSTVRAEITGTVTRTAGEVAP